MKRRDFERHLRQNACVLEREGTRHTQYFNPATGRSSSVPRHNEIPNDLVRKICKDLGIASPFA